MEQEAKNNEYPDYSPHFLAHQANIQAIHLVTMLKTTNITTTTRKRGSFQ